MKLRYNGDTRVTSAPLQIVSIAGNASVSLVQGVLNSSGFGTTTYTTITLNGTNLSQPIVDGYDLGNILPGNLATSTLLANLTLKFQISGGGLSYKIAELIVTPSVPEPVMLSLMGIAAAGLLRRDCWRGDAGAKKPTEQVPWACN